MSTTILTIPEDALGLILSYLTYDEIARCRLVCQKFNQFCGQLLTHGFWLVEKRHNALHKKMRAQLPRRESERRTHPFARHCDILTAIETRIRMLSMTYFKYIENKICCFIPGKVLDEIISILDTVEFTQYPPRTHDLLQELRDISSMAMEHFDETVSRLHQKVERPNVHHDNSSASKILPNVVLLKHVFSNEMKIYKKQARLHKHQMSSLTKSLKYLEIKFKGQTKLLHKNAAKVQLQAQILDEQQTKLREQEATIAELKQHIEEWDQNLADITSELVRAGEKLLGNTKPCMPTLKSNDLPTRSDFERKRKSPFISFTETPSKMPKRLGDAKIANVINNTLTKNISESFITSNVTTPKLNESATTKSSNFSKTTFGGLPLKKSLRALLSILHRINEK